MTQTPEEKAVVEALGHSGQLVVDLVNVKLKLAAETNAEEIRGLAKRYNQLAEDYKQQLEECKESNEAENAKLLTKLRDALDDALGKHRVAAVAVNSNDPSAPIAVKEAEDATVEALSAEALWKERVDKRLLSLENSRDDHEKRIKNIETRNDVPTLAPVPATEPAPEPVPEPLIGVESIEQQLDEPARTEVIATNTTHVQYLNPKMWGGLAWTLALVGALVGAIIALSTWAGFFPEAPVQLQWVRWITISLIPFIGFFLGGFIGSFIESKQSANQVPLTA